MLAVVGRNRLAGLMSTGHCRSALAVTIDRIHPDPTTGTGGVGINALYFFDPVDVTQGGANDRVVLDFAYLRSLIPLREVDVFMQDDADNYVSQQFGIAPKDGPFELQFAFDTFAPRGGGPGGFDPTHVHRLDFALIPAFFTPIDQIDFSTAIERVRFASAVPEPTTFGVGIVGLIASGCVSLHMRWFAQGVLSARPLMRRRR